MWGVKSNNNRVYISSVNVWMRHVKKYNKKFNRTKRVREKKAVCCIGNIMFWKKCFTVIIVLLATFNRVLCQQKFTQ